LPSQFEGFLKSIVMVYSTCFSRHR